MYIYNIESIIITGIFAESSQGGVEWKSIINIPQERLVWDGWNALNYTQFTRALGCKYTLKILKKHLD